MGAVGDMIGYPAYLKDMSIMEDMYKDVSVVREFFYYST